MPLRAIEIYFTMIHSKLHFLPKKYRLKFLSVLLVLYLSQLGIQQINFIINTRKIKKRKESRKIKFELMSQMLNEQKVPPDMLIPFLPLEDLSDQLQDSVLTPEMVTSAYLQQAINVDKFLNGIVDFIPVEFSEINKLLPSRPESQDHMSVKESVLYDAPKPAPESFFYQIYSIIFNPRKENKKELSSKNVSIQGNSLIMRETKKNMRRYSVYGIPSQDSTAGLSYHLDVMAEEEAVIVKVLKSQGAIPFIRTNVPQISIHLFGSSNPIYGTTKHPFIKGRSPGGCSSGEGSVIACRGSVLGVGTDVAGGIRIPAHFCGICGLKPTSTRVSKAGLTVVTGQEKIPVCVGPLSRNVDGLVRFLKAISVTAHFELDHKLYTSSKSLRIGYFIHDGYTKSIPAVEKSVLIAKTILEANGHQVVIFKPPDMKKMLTELFLPALLGNNSSDIHCYL
ncbi:hypothetical protein Btru_039300 [Bulinus truncatus]|nr:hypothetical protein Btru_039300 [Bulinus truncatus]